MSTQTWRIYADPNYSFSISYPPTFSFEVQQPAAPINLQLYRAVDRKYLCGYPLGEIEMGIYRNDTNSLSAWVRKHTNTGTADGTRFLFGVTDLHVVTVAKREAVAFQEIGVPELPTTIYATAFSFGSSRIFLIGWWSNDPAYLQTIQGIGQQMLSSFTG